MDFYWQTFLTFSLELQLYGKLISLLAKGPIENHLNSSIFKFYETLHLHEDMSTNTIPQTLKSFLYTVLYDSIIC